MKGLFSNSIRFLFLCYFVCSTFGKTVKYAKKVGLVNQKKIDDARNLLRSYIKNNYS